MVGNLFYHSTIRKISDNTDLPLRGQLLPALCIPHGGVVWGEIGVCVLQFPAVGPRAATTTLGLDVLEALPGVGLNLFAVQEHLALKALSEKLVFSGCGVWGVGWGVYL